MGNFLEFDEIQKYRRSVVVGNDVLNGVYTMSLLEYKFLYGALHQLQSTSDLMEMQKINKIDLKKFMNINGKTDDLLLDIIKRFRRRELAFRNKDTVYYSSWIWEVKFHKNDNDIDIRFNATVIPQLINLQSNFTQCDATVLSGAKCTYTERLYPMLKQYLKIGSRRLNVEDIVKEFILPKSYLIFGNMNRKVIQPAVEEINRISDIRVKVHYIKDSRKVIGFDFSIKEKPQATVTVETTVKEAVKDSIIKAILEWGKNDVDVNVLFGLQQEDESTEQFEGRLKDALNYCKTYRGIIKNRGALLCNAIKKSYQSNGIKQDLFKQEIKEQQQQIKEYCTNCPHYGEDDIICGQDGKEYFSTADNSVGFKRCRYLPENMEVE